MTRLRLTSGRAHPLALTVVAATVLAGAAVPAGASTTIGQTSALAVPCNLGNLLFQGSTAADPRYAVPPGGAAITSWSTQAGNYIGAMKLEVVRPLGANRFSVVAESGAQDLFPNHLNTFPLSPPLKVRPGDLLGLVQTRGTAACVFGPGTIGGVVAPGDTLLRTNSGIHPPVGTEFKPYGDLPLARLNVTAVVEPEPAPQPPPPPAQTPQPPSPPAAPAPAPLQISADFDGVRLESTRISLRRSFITLRLSCPAATAGPCTGRIKLSSTRRVSLGAAPFSIAPGTQARIRVHVPKAGRRLLVRVRRVRARATTGAHDAAGRSRTTVADVTIRRPRRAG